MFMGIFVHVFQKKKHLIWVFTDYAYHDLNKKKI